ncbi:MAG TPA: hypothetical protein VKR58_13130 [Aquella sp.]|nr:hypothetical protein [Aquella sp.]
MDIPNINYPVFLCVLYFAYNYTNTFIQIIIASVVSISLVAAGIATFIFYKMKVSHYERRGVIINRLFDILSKTINKTLTTTDLYNFYEYLNL